ncbi:MAG: sigma-54 dependent transcriptional regulator [Syntrophales bacterium]|nr:sigma-54 dependent transcriptional regulator [Syntrophales bacterium]
MEVSLSDKPEKSSNYRRSASEEKFEDVMAKLLIVDDEKNMRLVLGAMLKKEGYEVFSAGNGIEALNVLEKNSIDSVVTDLKMPHLDGLGLLEKIGEEYPLIPVIIITAHGTIANAVEAVKQGAFDYITKPFDQEDIKNIVSKAVKTKTLNEGELVAESSGSGLPEIIGTGPAMTDIYEIVKTVAPTTTTVLVQGETGTGKELVARAIHRQSYRSSGPFIKINCAAIPETLMESELFGYEKGAFTGAASRKPGRFEQAHNGTLFLDEIGELPKDMQAKLLRAIQDQEFERVGGLETIKVDVRLIAATNRDLRKDVKTGQFREDLYYRLNVLPVELPPLRERKEDIALLLQYFLDKFNRKLNRNIESVELDLVECCRNYSWPGNIRQMENLMERLVLLAKDTVLHAANLPPEIRYTSRAESVQAHCPDTSSFKDILKERTESIERIMIANVLEECNGNVSQAARKLGLSRKGLQLKMIKYGLRK